MKRLCAFLMLFFMTVSGVYAQADNADNNEIKPMSVVKKGDTYYLTLPLILNDSYTPAIQSNDKLVINLLNSNMSITTYAVDTCDIPLVYLKQPMQYVYYPTYTLSEYQWNIIKEHKISSMYRYVGFQKRPLFKLCKGFNVKEY